MDREASEKEKEKDLPTLKDNDFVKEGTKIHIGDTAKEKLLETLTADVGVSLDFSLFFFLFNLALNNLPLFLICRLLEIPVNELNNFFPVFE